MVYFSLVLPVYNVEPYIRRCVNSILEQKFDNYEIILVDDGSTDDSGKICDELQKTSEKIRTYHKTNGGLADARNYGMDRACGKYIIFIDSDDWISEELLLFAYAHLEKSNVDVLKYGFQKVLKGIYGEKVHSCFKEGIYDRREIESYILPGVVGPETLFNYKKNPIKSAWAHVYLLDFLKKNNIKFVSEREILNEDYLFNLNVMVYAKTLEVSHKVLYYYDFREGSLSKRYIKDMFERKQELYIKYAEIMKQGKCFEKYKEQYNNFCVDGYYACISNECSGWSKNSNLAIQNILKYLNTADCQNALRECKKNGMSVKGYIIYYLMKCKSGKMLYYLYQLGKQIQNK